MRVESGRQDGGVVAKKRIPRLQKAGQVGKRTVADGVRCAIDNQKPRVIPSRRRNLRDEMRRKNVIEKVGGERKHKARDCAWTLEPTPGFEPGTHALRKRCSTN